MNKLDMRLIDPNRKAGEVVSKGNMLVVERKVASEFTDFTGYFDDQNGELVLSIPGHGELVVPGFLAKHDVGNGPKGKTGDSGNSGVNGVIGIEGGKGIEGDRGIAGKRGLLGNLGYRGHQGDWGGFGPTGETGDKGFNSQIPMYIQEEDPGAGVGGGAIWVTVQTVEMLDTE